MENEESSFPINSKDQLQSSQVYAPPSKGFLHALTILAALSSILGLIFLYTIFSELQNSTTFSYLPGFIVGLLLVSGGIVLLIGLILINKVVEQSEM